ncbi:uncharacterized protein BJ171DRAFT_567225 [Polychytrium aggregatum]|uniref:uncharacterized protein n=1 Tax=Polychytrium aggregatum TaxID=110093 RepID=UPI0022FEB985|nr:uncharacterized protein BJ171DRAFT_567225 [Polychytrium aggregatum]KAI9205936.1 hypothetical protein BJ171DRAFT_567225 [Polychytrium aggregatum]
MALVDALSPSSDNLFECSAHGKCHDFFLSYRVRPDSKAVEDLKELLSSVALRRYGRPLSIFQYTDCLNTAKDCKDGFLRALPGSSVVILFLSKDSLMTMQAREKDGQEDNVRLEVTLALELFEAGKPITVMPLCLDLKDGSGYRPFAPYEDPELTQPSCPETHSLVKRLKAIQMYGYRPKEPHKRLYRLLNLLHPIAVDELTNKHTYSKYFCDPKFEIEIDKLDGLLKQITLTGRAIISGMGGMGKSVLARQFLRFMMGKLKVKNQTELSDYMMDTIGVKPQYSRVHWINCSGEFSALYDLSAIFPGVDRQEIKEHAAWMFANERDYLLVLDNVDDIRIVNSVFSHSRSLGFGGDVLVTTRLPLFPKGPFLDALKAKLPTFKQEPLKLERWSVEKTKRYILSASPSLQRKIQSLESVKALTRMLSVVDGHPLVAQSFVSHFENNSTPIDEFENCIDEVLQESVGDDETRSSLKVIVDQSMESMQKDGDERREACRIFGAIALLKENGIHYRLIKGIAQKLGSLIQTGQLLKRVTHTGLLHVYSNDTYHTHLLVSKLAWEYVLREPELKAADINTATGEALLELGSVPTDAKVLENIPHLEQYAAKIRTSVSHTDIHVKIVRLIEAIEGEKRACLGAAAPAAQPETAMVHPVAEVGLAAGPANQDTQEQLNEVVRLCALAQAEKSAGKHRRAIEHFKLALAIYRTSLSDQRDPRILAIYEQLDIGAPPP